MSREGKEARKRKRLYMRKISHASKIKVKNSLPSFSLKSTVPLLNFHELFFSNVHTSPSSSLLFVLYLSQRHPIFSSASSAVCFVGRKNDMKERSNLNSIEHRMNNCCCVSKLFINKPILSGEYIKSARLSFLLLL